MKLMETPEKTFENCFGRLRLTLDFASLAHQLSYIFVSDKTFSFKLKQ
jgi:hypothetical protein